MECPRCVSAGERKEGREGEGGRAQHIARRAAAHPQHTATSARAINSDALVPLRTKLAKARAMNRVATGHRLHSATRVEQILGANRAVRFEDISTAVVRRLRLLRPAHAALVAVHEILGEAHAAQATARAVKLGGAVAGERMEREGREVSKGEGVRPPSRPPLRPPLRPTHLTLRRIVVVELAGGTEVAPHADVAALAIRLHRLPVITQRADDVCNKIC